MKPLHSLFVGTLSASYALYSRDHRQDFANLLGSHENRALLEHLTAGIAAPLVGQFRYESKSYLHEFTGLYLIGHTVWELAQYSSRGFYQWDQSAVDVAGCVLGLMILRYGAQKEILEDENH